jgi:hypothetical protein
MLKPAKINSLKPDAKIKRYSDRDGLTLEVRPSGTKRFIVRFQWNKKPQTIAIGRYPSLSLADARQIAASYRALVDQGIDPRVYLKKESENKGTLKVIAEQWFQKNSRFLNKIICVFYN